MKKRKTARGFDARRRFFQDPFFRACQHGLEQLEERRLLSASPLTPDRSADPAWFGTVADPAQAMKLGQAFLNSVSDDSPLGQRVDHSRWIVQLNQAGLAQLSSPIDVANYLADSNTGLEVLRGLGSAGQVLVGAYCTQTETAVTFFQDHPWIESFSPDVVVSAASSHSADQRFPNDWNDKLIGLHNWGQAGGMPDADIDAPEAWHVETGSKDVVVAVIDSGIDYHHPDLAANIWTNPGEIPGNLVDDDGNGFTDDVHGWDFHNYDADPMDDHGHGTHVAGTIGAVGNNGEGITGVTWSTSLMALKFLRENSMGALTGWTSNAVEAINYATMMRTDHGINVRISNNSWAHENAATYGLYQAIKDAQQADILFVAAAGNSYSVFGGRDIDQAPVYPASFGLDNMLTVAATDQKDQLFYFSNHGDETVHLAAPGVGIYSTYPQNHNRLYRTNSGTSMAAPHVSGTAALVWSHLPDATMTEVRNAILEGVDVVPQLQGAVVTGGRLNALGALTVDTYFPRTTLAAPAQDITSISTNPQSIHINYRDNVAIVHDSLDNNDLVVRRVGTSDSQWPTELQTAIPGANAAEIDAIYQMQPPGGIWSPGDNGIYEIWLEPFQVSDTAHLLPAGQLLGTFEVALVGSTEFTVNTLADTVDMDIKDGLVRDGDGRISLRAAIQETNALDGTNTIRLPAGNYTLSIPGIGEDDAATGDLDIRDDLVIVAEGRVTIDGADLDRVFDVASGVTFTLHGLTITGGKTSGDGGALRNIGGTVVIEQGTLTGNAAAYGGALVNHNSGTLTVTTSTISGNTATSGGAISNNSGTVTLGSTTITANTATIGGGVDNLTGTVNLQNTIVAGNTATSANPDINGAISSGGHNLVGDGTGSSGLTHAQDGDQVGSSASPIDARLGPLQDNDGPAWTHVPLEGSPAIDAGNNSAAPAHDQRGITIPQDGDGDNTKTVDIGAVEKYYAQIQGTKYHDLDGNGAQDDGEAGIADWIIYLDINGNKLLDVDEPNTVTDANGDYLFSRLAPGNYNVAELHRAGWDQTSPLDSSAPPEFTVNTTADTIDADPGDGQASDSNGNTSLRAAIMEANAQDQAATITLLAGTYRLSIAGVSEENAGTGDLDIKTDLTLVGAGAASTIIDGNTLDRVLDISADVSIRGVTITGGRITAEGGGIRNTGTLSLVETSVSGNWSPDGGGLFNAASGTVSISSSTVSNNTGEDGGGIDNKGNLTVTNSTISGNDSILFQVIQGNTSNGGAILNSGPNLTIINSTIASNTTDQNIGGLYHTPQAGTLTLKNSILADNSTAGNPGPDLWGSFVSLGNNLIEHSTNSGGFVSSDLRDVDPKLGPLADNGGPTATHTLLADSPAIDAGSNDGAPATDQRGISRPIDGDNNGTTIVDLGAVEVQPVLLSVTVNTTADTVDVNLGDGVARDSNGNTSLRAAIMEANSLPGTATINVPTGTYRLLLDGADENNAATGDLDIKSNITLIGQGIGLSILDGNASDRLLDIKEGASLSLEGLTLQAGKATSGGAITSLGQLSIKDSLFSGNSATGGSGGGAILQDGTSGGTLAVETSTFKNNTAEDGYGGAINIQNGALSILASTFQTNTATPLGGAIFATRAPLTISNSTFSGNRATSGHGGAIHVGPKGSSSTTITSSTFTANISSGLAGAIYSERPLVIGNTIVAGNTAATHSADIDISLSGSFSSAGNNLVGSSEGSSITNGTNGDLVGTAGSPLDPRLGPLADNGGPTATHALLASSPAIDAGNNNSGPSTDQRGITRPLDGDNNGTPVVDIGSFEYAPPSIAFSVNTTADTVDANPGDGAALDSNGKTSLRAAIMEANALPGADLIILGPATYRLTLAGGDENNSGTGDLDITSDISIVGAGADKTTIDANDLDRVFQLVVDTGARLHLQDLTVTGGDTRGTTDRYGGGIFNDGGTLKLDSVHLTDNYGDYMGGGLFNAHEGTVVITASAITGNLNAGGINNYSGSLEMHNSTVSGNRGDRHAGISGSGTLSLSHVTVVDNVADTASDPDIFHDYASEFQLSHSLVGTIRGAITSSGHNLVINADGSTGLVHDFNGDQAGTSHAPINVMLGPLADNGGPTPTHALLSGSPAIDAGSIPFSTHVLTTSAVGASDVHAIDVDGDGDMDLLSASSNDNKIAWHENDGNNNFTQHTITTAAASAGSVYASDMDGDGDMDVLSASMVDDKIAWYESSRTFTAATTFGTGAGSFFSSVGDFNADGKQDLAVVNYDGPGSILLGDGDGSFAPATTFPFGYAPFSSTVGDFNGDGKQDLVTANSDQGGNGNVRILLGNGDGTFPAATSFATDGATRFVSVGDFNGDGKQDLATANHGSNNVSILLGSGTGSFAAASHFTVGASPEAVSIGYFNNDNIQDLAVANTNGNSVSILLGDGNGSFATATTFAVGVGPKSVAVEDFDRDGNQDLAVANTLGNTVNIMLGDGSGSFSTATHFPVGNGPRTVMAGDFNGDNKLDLVTNNTDSGSVSILLGNGNGSFAAATSVAVGPSPHSVSVADFNGDGKHDLAVPSRTNNNVSVLLGKVAFTAQTITTSADGARSVYASDVDGDGDMDVLSASMVDDKIAWYENDGDEHFTAHTITTAADDARDVHASDIDGDGDIDVLSASQEDNTIAWYENSRTFSPATNFTVDPGAPATGTYRNWQHSGGDDADFQAWLFQGSGFQQESTAGNARYTGSYETPWSESQINLRIAIAVTTPSGNSSTWPPYRDRWPQSISLQLYNFDTSSYDVTVTTPYTGGTLSSGANHAMVANLSHPFDSAHSSDGYIRARYDLIFRDDSSSTGYARRPSLVFSSGNQTTGTPGTDPSSVAAGDFNGDGHQDLATTNRLGDNVSILLGQAGGSFSAPTTFATGDFPYSAEVADFNRDGDLDLATANLDGDNVSILLGNGDGSFDTATHFPAGNGLRSLSLGDFNADGHRDVATANLGGDNVSILLGDGNGSFGAPTLFTVANAPRHLATADFNGDGNDDLVTANEDSNNVSILLGNGNGSFAVATNFAAGNKPSFVSVADFDNDGNQDLSVANRDGNNVSILLGNGNGSFTAASHFSTGDHPRSLWVTDFDDDGNQDLAAVALGDHAVSILLGAGNGSFAAARNYATDDDPFWVTAADFNHDGKQDLAVANIASESVSILLGKVAFAEHTISTDSDGASSAHAIDMDDDGDMDIISASANDNTIAWYENDGDENFTPHVVATDANDARRVYAADVDDDGDMDLLSASYADDKIAWYENDGDENFSPHTITTAADGAASVYATDVDGDGDMDILSASYENDTIAWHENSPLLVDQRGIARPADGNLDGSFLVDIGAYELVDSGRIEGTVYQDNGADGTSALNRTETFDSNPNWTSFQNTVSGNSYMYAAGRKSIGGRFARSDQKSYYADTNLNAPLSLDQPFSASGELDLTVINNMNHAMKLGYFKHATITDLIGFHLTETHDAVASGLDTVDIHLTGPGFASDPIRIDNVVSGPNRNWTIDYDPDAGSAGRLTFWIDGPTGIPYTPRDVGSRTVGDNGGSISVDLTSSQRLAGGAYTAFGIYQQAFDSPSQGRYFDLYLDNLDYTVGRDPGLAGTTVFLDVNNNGQLDDGEPRTETLADNVATSDVNELGNYSFTNLPSADYTVAQVIPDSWQQTEPDGTGNLAFMELETDTVAGVDGLEGANHVTVSPDGKHLYSAGSTANAIAVFNRDQATGEISFLEVHRDGVSGVDGLANPSSLSVSPDGKHLYATSADDHAVVLFSRNAASGALTYVTHYDQQAGVGGMVGANSIKVSPDGLNVYVASTLSSTLTVFDRDTATGELTFIERHTDDVGGLPTQLAKFSETSIGVTDGLASFQMSGNIIASKTNTGNGAVRIWQINDDNTLQHLKNIGSPHSTAGPSFGHTILIQDNFLGISSKFATLQATHDGRFYVYDLDDFKLKTHLNPAPENAAYFGCSSALGNDFFVVGECGNWGEWNTEGAITAYHYNADDLSTSQIFRKEILSAGTGGSRSSGLAIHGDTVVGAFERETEDDQLLMLWKISRDNDGNAVGLEPIYQITEANNQETIGVSHNELRTNGEYIAIGRYDKELNGTSGHVQLMRINLDGTMTHERTIVPPNAVDGMKFGKSILFDENLLYISAPLADVGQPGTGMVYVYDMTNEASFSAPLSFSAAALQEGEQFGQGLTGSNKRLGIASGEDTFYLFDTANLFSNTRVDDLDAAQDVTISSDGNHVYVASQDDNAVAVFSRNASTGSLTPVQFDPDSGLLLHLGLNGDTLDQSGNEHHGINRGASPGTGILGANNTAMIFDRGNAVPPTGNFGNNFGGDWIELTSHNLDDQIENTLTFSFWLKFTEYPDWGVREILRQDRVAMLQLSNQSHGESLNFSVGNASTGAGTPWNSGIRLFENSDGPFADNQWRHYVYSVSDSGQNVYVDGKLAGTLAGSVVIGSNDYKMGVGPYLDGSLDELRIYNRGLTAFEAERLYELERHSGLHGARSLVVSPADEHVYVTSSDDNTLSVFGRDPVSGVLTLMESHTDGVAGVNGLEGASPVLISPDGNYVYANGPAENSVAIFSRDSVTGQLTYQELIQDSVGTSQGISAATGAATSPDGQHIYIASPPTNTVAAYRRNAPVHYVTLDPGATVDSLDFVNHSTEPPEHPSFDVNTTADTVDANLGDSLARDATGHTSLRAAIMEANALAGKATIIVPAGTYQLSLAGAGEDNAATGDLDIHSDVTLIGAGADITIINANSLDRIFDIRGNVSISGVTITGGQLNGHGGGIYTSGTLELLDSVVSGNSGVDGGGVYTAGTTTIVNSTIRNNTANTGAGLYSGGTTHVINSVIADNNTPPPQEGSYAGGGITNRGTLIVTGSTISGNRATGGAGILNNSASAIIRNSTISGNIVVGLPGCTGCHGGGILTMGDPATVVIENTTISDNTTNGNGGGIGRLHNGSVTIGNTIVAGNTAAKSGPDINGAILSNGHNVIGNTSGTSGLIESDQTNVDPKLSPLADNGGPTLTHALLAGSPAIDAGLLFSGQTIASIDGPTHLTVIDVDGDTDLDLVAASAVGDPGGRMLAWYENDGNHLFTPHVVSTAETVKGVRMVDAADLDGDGDTDLLSAAFMDGTIAWYENDGDQNFSQHVLTTDADGAFFVRAIDLDSDDDLDILGASHHDGTIAWYENVGNATFTAHTITTTATKLGAISPADMDDDGDLDLLWVSGENAFGVHQRPGTVAWLENDGNQSFSQHVISTSLNGGKHVEATDLNGDGDTDFVLVEDRSNTLSWYANNGDQSFSKHVISTAVTGGETTFTIDMDSDGDLDILSGGEGASAVTWHINDGNENFTSQHIDGSSESVVAGIYAVDLDGDNDLDILSADHVHDTLSWYETVGTMIDQRGITRPLDGNNDGSAGIDIGAYELGNFGAIQGSVYQDGDGSTAINRTETFDSDPGWVAVGSGVNLNNFGYQPGSSLSGGSPGEIGGRFTRSDHARYYGDTNLLSTLDLNQPISGSGKLHFDDVNRPDFGQPLWIGHFNTESPGVIYGTPGGFKANKLGFLFSDVNDETMLGWGAGLILENGYRINSAMNEIDPNIERTFAYSWDPQGGDHQAGRLTATLSGPGGGTRVIDLTPSQHSRGASFDGFGFAAPYPGPSNPISSISVDIYIDDVTYTAGYGTGLAGTTVFLDNNSNGQLDDGESSTATLTDDPETTDVNELGSYTFTNLPAGDYTVSQVIPDSWQQTEPVGSGSLTFVELETDGLADVDGLDHVDRVVVSPDGKHLYSAGIGGITVFNRDQVSGKMTFLEVHRDGVSGVDGLAGPSSLSVSPDGKHLYATGFDDHAIVLFSRNAATGALTYVTHYDQQTGVGGINGARRILISPDGLHAYVASLLSSTLTVFSRNSETGELSFIERHTDNVGGVNGLDAAFDVAISSDGTSLYIPGHNDHAVAVFSRNSNTGKLTYVEVQAGLTGARSVVVSPGGKHVYVARQEDDTLSVFSRDTSSGALTLIENHTDGAAGVEGLDGALPVLISPDGDHVYLSGSFEHSLAIFRRDPGTGKLTYLERIQDGVDGALGLHEAAGATISPDGRHLYFANSPTNTVSAYRRDFHTHTVTLEKNALLDGLNFVNQLPSLVALDDSYTIANDAALVRPQLLLRDEDFNGVPNWAALGSGSGGNEFSYHQDSNFAGGIAGEVGGRFTRSGFSKHLADTQFSSELDVEKAIHADGRLDVTGWNHADFGNGMSVGHFSTNGQATLGISFTDNSTGSNLYWYGIVQFDDGTLAATGHTQITSPNSNRSWSYDWDPTGGDQGAGALTFTLDGVQHVLQLTEAQRNRGLSNLNAFGFNGNAASSPNSNKYADIFIDDVSYTAGFQSGLLDNDYSGEAQGIDMGSDVTTLIVTQPTHGSLELASDSSFTYTPRQDFSGLDSFQYRLTDGESTSNVATVTITVTGSTSGGGSSDVTSSAGSWTVPLHAGQVITGRDFGNRAQQGQIGGQFYNDKDQDGQQSQNEPALADWTVYLDLNDNSQQDNQEPAATSNASGHFLFPDLDPLTTYVIREVPQQDWLQSQPSSDLDGKWTIYLEAGQNIDTAHFGNHENTVTGSGGNFQGIIRGRYFLDVNGNRHQDNGEPGLAGETVFLDLNKNGLLDDQAIPREPSDTTASDGSYFFEGLIYGTYQVAMVLPQDKYQTFPVANELASTDFETGLGPRSATSGDFNGDGVIDLAVANGSSNDVSVLLADTTGSYHSAASYDVGFGPSSITVAQLTDDNQDDVINEDDLVDLVVTNSFSGDISLLVNQGNGVFSEASNYATGAGPRSVAHGDFNADGYPDLAIAHEYDDQIAVLLNNSQGTLGVSQAYPVGNSPVSIATGHLDADSYLDLVVTNFLDNNVSILIGLGNGTFNEAVTIAVGNNPFSLQLADMNDDTNLDIVTANASSNSVSVLYGHGNGTFALPLHLAAGNGPTAVVAGDLDIDGDLDLAVSNTSSGSITLLRNLGNGVFSEPESHGVGHFAVSLPYSLVMDDLDNDGDLDLAVAKGSANRLSVLTNTVVPDIHTVTLTPDHNTVDTIDFGVNHESSAPTLDSLPDVNINEDAGKQTIELKGITAGTGETQPIAITASSSNPGLVPQPAIDYTSPNATGLLSFTPVNDAHGSTIITISVTDGGPDNDLAAFQDNVNFTRNFLVTIAPLNDAPVSRDASFAPEENKVLNVVAEDGLLALSSDVEDDTLTFTIVTSTAHGQLNTSADGSFNYQPNQGFNRTDFFTYRVNDGTEDGNLARIDFHIDTPYAWYNCLKPLDVNDDQLTTPLDVLWIINNLNANGSGPLVNARTKPLAAPFYDVNKDGVAAPLDALIVINYLNMAAGEGEGESSRGYYETPLSTGPLNVAPVRSAASTTTATAPAAATELLPQDDSYRTAALLDQAADLLGDRSTARLWEAAVDQLLEEDLDFYPGKLTGKLTGNDLSGDD